jgi:nicotinamidase-related amidase
MAQFPRPRLPTIAALIVIGVQKAFDLPRWGNRNNPGTEANNAHLIAAWRASGRPVFHVHHKSASPEGVFHSGDLAIETKPEALPADGEPLYWKSVNSAFVGTTLEADLRRAGITPIIVIGLTANRCVSTTVRMAGNRFVIPRRRSAKRSGGGPASRHCSTRPASPAGRSSRPISAKSAT